MLGLGWKPLTSTFIQVAKNCVLSSQNLRVEVLKFCLFKNLEHDWNSLKNGVHVCIYAYMENGVFPLQHNSLWLPRIWQSCISLKGL